jgi:transposase-like protein
VVSQKNGASALGLKRVFGFGSYQTAWAHLHKLRRAMVTPGRKPLFGRIEVDESYLGGLEEGVRGRQTFKKALVVIAAEEQGKRAIGRIRMRRIPDASADSLQLFVVESIQPGSLLHTDGWRGYSGLERLGFIHQITTVSTHKENTSELLPRVHRVASLLKRWVLGTHQGAISPEHLDYYLDEFTFRFNRRTSRSRGKLFYRLLQNAVRVPPAPYRTMVKNVRGPTSNDAGAQHIGGT